MATRAAAAASALALCCAVTACGHPGRAASDRVVGPTSGMTPTPPSATQPPSALSARAEVARVGLRSSEIPTFQQVLEPRSGRTLRLPTLDQCGGSFSTEAHRLARRQIWAMVPGSHVRYSNEVVAYDSADSALLALRQLQDATTHCPTGPVAVSRGRSPATFRILSTTVNDTGLPVPTSFAFAEAVTRGGRTTYAVMLFQQRGDVLDGMYLTAPDRPTERQVALARREAVVTGRRLLALPLRSVHA